MVGEVLPGEYERWTTLAACPVLTTGPRGLSLPMYGVGMSSDTRKHPSALTDARVALPQGPPGMTDGYLYTCAADTGFTCAA